MLAKWCVTFQRASRFPAPDRTPRAVSTLDRPSAEVGPGVVGCPKHSSKNNFEFCGAAVSAEWGRRDACTTSCSDNCKGHALSRLTSCLLRFPPCGLWGWRHGVLIFFGGLVPLREQLAMALQLARHGRLRRRGSSFRRDRLACRRTSPAFAAGSGEDHVLVLLRPHHETPPRAARPRHGHLRDDELMARLLGLLDHGRKLSPRIDRRRLHAGVVADRRQHVERRDQVRPGRSARPA